MATQPGEPGENPSLFESVGKKLAERASDRNLLLNIPIWGWTGDGKTCALLTALHFLEPLSHSLGLALVVDCDELVELEGSVAQYEGLNLVSTARATTQRLSRLSELLNDECLWPPGTDEATPYLLAIRTVRGTAAHVVFPDLMGGSYQQADNVARAVLRQAHGCIVLVNPVTYVAKSVQGKNYRTEIAQRIAKCAELKVPTAVLITKSDLYPGQDSPVDEVERAVTVMLDAQGEFCSAAFRVSVIGDTSVEGELEDGHLPEVEKRDPLQLLEAFVWLLGSVLEQPADSLLEKVPALQFRAVAAEGSQDAVLVGEPELRQVGEFSNRPGIVLCPSSAEREEESFLFLRPPGEIVRIEFSGEDPKRETLGSAANWDSEPDSARIQAELLDGEIALGQAREVNEIWYGRLADQLPALALSAELCSWVLWKQDRLLALDSAGRVHSLQRRGETWIQVSFLPDFISPTEYLVCGLLKGGSSLACLNGVDSHAIWINPDGTFGARGAAPVAATFDAETCMMNRAGLVAAVRSDSVLVVSTSQVQHEVGPVHPEADELVAVAGSAPVVAFVAPDMTLRAVRVSGSGEEVAATEDHLSPVLAGLPESMAWNNWGTKLVLTFSDGLYALYETFGFGSES